MVITEPLDRQSSRQPYPEVSLSTVQELLMGKKTVRRIAAIIPHGEALPLGYKLEKSLTRRRVGTVSRELAISPSGRLCVKSTINLCFGSADRHDRSSLNEIHQDTFQDFCRKILSDPSEIDDDQLPIVIAERVAERVIEIARRRLSIKKQP